MFLRTLALLAIATAAHSQSATFQWFRQVGGSAGQSVAGIATDSQGNIYVAGLGQGYILNEDGTLNSPANPAKEGSPITIFATGVGPLSFVDGYAVTSSLPTVTVGGWYANGIAASFGPVAGFPGSVYQISVYVPRPSDFANVNPTLKGFVLPPTVAVSLEVGGARTQAGLALSVTH